MRKAYEKSIPILKASDFNSLTGHGVFASYLEKRIFIGNFRKDDDEEIVISIQNDNNESRSSS